jgi:hypothetical protein
MQYPLAAPFHRAFKVFEGLHAPSFDPDDDIARQQ